MSKVTISLVLMLIAAAGVYLSQDHNDSQLSEFQKWKLDNQINYQSELEDHYRQRVFLENVKLIIEHNSNPHKSYEMGINQFTAMTKEQFVQKYLSSSVLHNQNIQIKDTQIINVQAEDVDWVQKGAVTPVKNQGQCGASWAFSCIGGLEGLSKVADGVLKKFSEQQLIDCTSPYGNKGCNGGFPQNAYKFVKQHGICTQDEYPYRAVVQTCKNCTNPFKISGYNETKSCPELEKAIQHQPVSVLVDATNWATYRSGVLSTCATNINHAVLLVGIVGGAWKVKNQWGSAWGENGYIRLASGNTCGICSYGSYPNK